MDDNFIAKLSEALADFKISVQETIEFAKQKQKHRAEPWQEIIIERLSRALDKFEAFMKESDT